MNIIAEHGLVEARVIVTQLGPNKEESLRVTVGITAHQAVRSSLCCHGRGCREARGSLLHHLLSLLCVRCKQDILYHLDHLQRRTMELCAWDLKGQP